MSMYGFTVQNWKARALEIPMSFTHSGQRVTLKEDSFAYDEQRKIACVADGVTRDFLDGSVVTHDLKGIMKFLNGEYPSPSPAREAADICINTFMQTDSLRLANEPIGGYNHKKRLVPTNYLEGDLAGCTAAAISEENGKINWSFIADSGIAVIGKNGNLKFKTPDQGPHSTEKLPYLEGIVKENGEWENPKSRVAIRSQYRNNPQEKFAYGVLTGEEAALHYIRQGIQDINLGDYVLVFTDGMGELLFPQFEKDKKDERKNKKKREVRDKCFKYLLDDNSNELERICRKNVHTEGTLVVYKVE